MHLVAECALSFTIAGQSFAMGAGDSIHTENSHKFSLRSAALLLMAGGWQIRTRWLDADALFAIMLADRASANFAP